MWVNPRLVSKLSESYSNGDVGRSYGGNYTNSYPNTTFNNFAGDDNYITNQNSINTINPYNGNPEGTKQQQRFNEIANQVLNQQREFNEQTRNNENVKLNNNLLEFVNSLSHPINNRNAVMPPSMIPQSQQLPQSAQMTQIDDSMSRNMMNEQLQQQEINNVRPMEPIGPINNTETFIPYRMERKYRNGELTNDLFSKNTTVLIIVLCVIGFILFMLVQLYMSQKKLEYMVNIYRNIPINSPYYITQQAMNSLPYEQ